MPNEMTATEAAEKLEEVASGYETYVGWEQHIVAMRLAASYLRKIAAGEYKRVVHAHITGHGYDLHCSNCGASADIGDDYCKSCGALMDGKDDSRVEK
jgi:hypothetical protein